MGFISRRKKYLDRKENNLCVTCGENKEDNGIVNCNKCNENHKKYDKKIKRKKYYKKIII